MTKLFISVNPLRATMKKIQSKLFNCNRDPLAIIILYLSMAKLQKAPFDILEFFVGLA